MEADQFFSLQWNQHKGTIVSTFEKFFERNAFVDCTLAAEGQYLNVHKMILTACSPYFEVLLSQNHDKHPIIILKDVTFRELKAIVDYMYRGIANVSSTEMKDFLAAAASLQIKGLGKTNEELRNGVDEKMEFVGPQPLPSNVMEMSGTIVQGERSNLRSSPPVLDHPLPPNASLFDSEFGRDVRSAPQQNIQSSEKVQGVEFEETWMKTEPVNETCLNENYNLPTQPLVGGIHTIELVKNISNGPENTPLVGCLSTIPSVESSNILQMNVSPKHEPNVATQDVETASVSSVIELSDTSEECGELDMDDDTTPGGLWHSSQNTIAYESEASFSQQDGGSDVTQPSLASGDQDTENVQQGIANIIRKVEFDVENPTLSYVRAERSLLAASSDTKIIDLVNQNVVNETPDSSRYRANRSLKLYRCPQCPKVYRKPTSLLVHLRSHVDESTQNSQKATASASKTGLADCARCKPRANLRSARTFTCASCRTPVARKALQGRANALAATSALPCTAPRVNPRIHPGPGPIKYRCSLCGLDFSSADILSYHLRTHTRQRPFGCEVCPVACPPTMEQSEEQSTSGAVCNPAGDRSFRCSDCGKVFKKSHRTIAPHRRSVNAHSSRVHTLPDAKSRQSTSDYS